MSWSYSGNPGSSPRDEVRFLIGDSRETKQSLSDGEIDYLIEQANGNATSAAVEAALSTATRYAALSATSKKVGDLSLSSDYGATAARFEAVAARLRKTQRSVFAPIISAEQEKDGYFSMGMDDYGD